MTSSHTKRTLKETCIGESNLHFHNSYNCESVLSEPLTFFGDYVSQTSLPGVKGKFVEVPWLLGPLAKSWRTASRT